MNEKIKENSVIIVKDAKKVNFLEKIRREKGLFNIKVLGLNEFKKKYFFDYTNETVYYVHKTYHVIKDVANIYLENLYYIKEEVKDEKVVFLKQLKNDLESNDLLIKDLVFRNYIENQTIVLYGLDYIDKFYEEIFKDLEKKTKVIRIDEDIKLIIKKPLFRFSKKRDELAFVASKICELLKSGIDINRIKIANVKDDYLFQLKNIFKDFNIPIELPNNESISSTIIVKEFKNRFNENLESVLDDLKNFITSAKDNKIYDLLLDKINEYYWAPNYMEIKDFLFDDIDRIKVPTKLLKNAVKIIDIDNYVNNDEDFVFLINFNQGAIPINKKDEDYLNDYIKNELKISDSIDFNTKQIKKVQDFIINTSNLTVTYIDHDISGELYISNAYSEEILLEKVPLISYEHSNAYNRKLLLSAKDENRKYGTKSDTFLILTNHYKDEPYNSYDNTFKGLDKEKLNALLENKLTLSYSSMNSYFKCGFRYYLEYILRLNKFEDTFEIIVGNIFHEVLSVAFKDDFDFDESWLKAIEHTEYKMDSKENFFLKILKEELQFIISNIEDALKNTSLDKALFEEKIIVLIDKEKNVTFKGFVDKILYGEFENEIIAAIVDYKTGFPELNIDNAFYGIDMQLPIYAYLIKNYDPLKNAKIGGFYLQKILNNTKDTEKKREALKLQGYSNSDIEILSKVDKTYENSELIKSLKMGRDGFSSYSKVLSTEQINRLTDLVHEKILEAASDITNAQFDINPKEIDGKMNGCNFCQFKDICFMKNSDIIKLKKQTKEEFLGGDLDADVD